VRRLVLVAALLFASLLGIIGIAILALSAGACTTGSGSADQASGAAKGFIPPELLQIYEQVGPHYGLPWELLAGIATEECSQGRTPDPACTLQPGATGPGAANYAGASGLMQIGIGGAAGDEYDSLRHYLPNPALGPHDPVTAVQLAALVLIKDKGAPTNQPIDAYLPYARAYNGSGPAADAYASRVIADAHTYQGAGTTTFVSESFSCPATAATLSGYLNPLAHAPHAVAERIDMGVDYADPDPEPIDALGAGTVTYAGPQGGGWQPSCVNYTLAQPPSPTERYIYVCEQITPTVQTGESVQAGQELGTFIPGGGIEIGFAAAPGSPVSTRAAALRQQAQAGDAGANRTYCGQAMGNLIQQAGGPPGLTEGRSVVGTSC
jgi:hypothetical protein